MSDKEAYRKLEQEKFRDEAVIYRQREAAVAALNFSTFVTAIGPLGIVLMKMVNALPVGPVLGYLIYATAPIGLVMTIVNYVRTPSDYRGAKLVLRPVAMAAAAAVATFALSAYWGPFIRKVVEETP